MKTKEIRSILIANRGEIACRVIKTCKKLGIKSIAVYSDVDRDALHVQMADEAYHIGPSAPSESYLKEDLILQTAIDAGADAIHPGYGFLSENASFAQKVSDSGVIFIGPRPKAITLMGDKLQAKDTVKQHNVPLVPGTEDAIDDIDEAKDIIQSIGLPVLIKASAGGGGKGMRLVEHMDEVESQIAMAMSEAKSAFGNGSVFIEKFVTNPRHIEIQVVCDQHGNGIHCFERDCSIQRRHQKVVEEAPSAVLTEEQRMEMGATAVRVAQSCDYVGAGTVEFLLADDGSYYFLEMNTRLQVEHPITEMITGVDLVEMQISIAEGHPLSVKQEDLSIHGHAIELRIYAEDPANGFVPSIGTLERYQIPESEHVRLDSGYLEGMEIPIYYDPMIAKLVVWAETRAAAIQRMSDAIRNSRIKGIESTLDFGQYVMKSEAFSSGHYTTNYVKEHFRTEELIQVDQELHHHIAQIGTLIYEQSKSMSREVLH